jgi:hypothetical protein
MKFLVGILGTLGLIAIIAGPLLLFSSLNPIAEDNYVIGTKLELSIEVNVTTDTDIINKYTVFNNDQVSIIRPIQDQLYNKLNLGTDIRTKNLKRYLMQEIMMSPTSDTIWNIAPPSQAALHTKVKNAILEPQKESINLRLTYSFLRDNPPGNQEVSNSIAVDVTRLSNNITILNQLLNATDPDLPCNENNHYKFMLVDMYIPIVQLYELGDPEVVNVQSQKTNITILKS